MGGSGEEELEQVSKAFQILNGKITTLNQNFRIVENFNELLYLSKFMKNPRFIRENLDKMLEK